MRYVPRAATRVYGPIVLVLLAVSGAHGADAPGDWAKLMKKAADVFEACQRSVVLVEGLSPGGLPMTRSSGVVVAPGQVVTTYRCVREQPSVRVKVPGLGEVKVVGLLATDKAHNLALLKLDSQDIVEKMVPLALASTPPPVDAPVVAIGCSDSSSPHIVSNGRILGVKHGRDIDKRLPPDTVYVATNARISADTAGGPLVDMDKQIVGINIDVDAAQGKTFYAVGTAVVRELLRSAEPSGPGESAGDKRPAGLGPEANVTEDGQHRQYSARTVTQRGPAAMKTIRCSTCRGSGMVKEERDAGYKRTMMGPKKTTKTVLVPCEECGGSGIVLRKVTYDKYCELAQSCVFANPESPHMAEALDTARKAFRMLSADNEQLGLEINYFARHALGNPQRKGRPVVFYGKIYKILHRRSDKDVLVQLHGAQQQVAAQCNDDIFAVVGDTVVVAGLMWGFSAEEEPKGRSERLVETMTMPRVRAWYVEVVQKGSYDARLKMQMTANSRAPVGTAAQTVTSGKRRKK